MTSPDGPPEIVLDTNVVLDAWLFGEPSAQPLRAALGLGRLRWVTTAAMLDELAHVLARPLPPRWEPQRQAVLGIDFGTLARRVDAPAPLAAGRRLPCTDPDDQKFIDLAVARRCRWLLSRDRALLRLRRRAADWGVAVLRPEDWPAPAG